MNGEADAYKIIDLSSHLGECARCSDTAQMLLQQDTVASRLITGGKGVPETPVPAGLIDKLVALSSVRSPGEGATIGYAGDSEEAEAPSDMLAPPAAPGELGRLNAFIVRKVLGRGGMGVVFLAEDPRLEREVALKVIRPNVAKNPTARKRFLSEARSAAKVKSDHIVTIYDIGEAGDVAYVAMEVLQGASLGALAVAGKTFPVSDVLRVAREAALGLAAAHEKGLIHRDIKPDNIWLEAPNGRVKLLDFGLARPIDQEVHLTNEGVVVGTPSFMAPEQANGHRVDARGDLFSFGCVLYLMLTGRLPFPGKSVLETLSALATVDPPRVRSINPAVPSKLDELVARLLAKDPDHRPASAKAVVEEIQAIEAKWVTSPLTPIVDANPPAVEVRAVVRTPTTRPEEDRTDLDFSAQISSKDRPAKAVTQPERRRKFPLAAMVALGLILFGGGALAIYQFAFANKEGTLVVEVTDDADVRFKNGKLEIYDESGKKLYTLEPSERNKMLPAGKYLVKVVGTEGIKLDTDKFELERKGKVLVKVTADQPPAVARNNPPREPGTVQQPKITPIATPIPVELPKGAWPVGPRENTLPGLIPQPAILDGIGRWQIVPTVVPAWGLSWSPDGKWMATYDDTVLRLYDANTGALAKLFMLNKGQPIGQSPVVDWSPDSKWLRCSNRRPTGVLDGLTFAALDGSSPAAKFETSANRDYGWNPRHNVAAWIPHSTFDRIEIIDPTQVKPIEIAVKVGGKGKAVWSPDGETLLVVREDNTAQLFGRDGKAGAKLEGTVDAFATPAWSADGNLIAATANPNQVGFWKKDGARAPGITGKHESGVLALNWHPNGKQIAVTDTQGKRHFWKIDGTSEGVANPKDGAPGFVWAKDGRGFFTPGKFWPAVGNPSFTNLITELNMSALVSPDQKSVALAKRGEIVIAELTDGVAKDIGWKVLQTRDGMPWWSPDGKRLAVVDQNGVSLYDARNPANAVRLGGGVGVNGLNRSAFSPKGDRLAVANDIGHVFICEPSGKPLRVLTAPSKVGMTLADAIHDIQWHPDGKLVAVTTGAVTATIYDSETGKLTATTSLAGVRPGGGATFSPTNPDHLLVAHPDTAALWRWKVEREPLQKLSPGLGKILPSPDGGKLLSLQAGGGWYGNDLISAAILSPDLKTRDTENTKKFVATNNHPGPSLVWHPDGKHFIASRDGSGTIKFFTVDGKLAEEIKPDGIDVTWMEWASSNAQRSVLVGRINSDVYLFDVAGKKLTPFAKKGGEVAMSPDGAYILALENSTIQYWNVKTKAIEQIVQLLPDTEYAIFSPAGEVLFKSAGAAKFLRYVIEDREGRLTLQDGAAFAGGKRE